jgi:hypothetical protein
MLIFECPAGGFICFPQQFKIQNPKSNLNNRHASIHPDPPAGSALPP